MHGSSVAAKTVEKEVSQYTPQWLPQSIWLRVPRTICCSWKFFNNFSVITSYVANKKKWKKHKEVGKRSRTPARKKINLQHVNEDSITVIHHNQYGWEYQVNRSECHLLISHVFDALIWFQGKQPYLWTKRHSRVKLYRGSWSLYFHFQVNVN